jgi:hypothetical protein
MVAVLADIPQPPACAPSLRLVDGRRMPRARPEDRPVRRARPSAAVLRRRRLVAAAALAVLVVGALVALQAALAGGGGGPLTTAAGSPGAARPAAVHAWVAQPGDTLWSIALAVHPHGDVRPLVDRLSAELHGRPLLPGQRVLIP